MVIVCGTDFSSASRSAAAAAAALAARLEAAEFWIVHVLDASTRELDPKAFDSLNDRAKERLQQEAGDLKTRFGVRVLHQVVAGGVAETLLAFAAQIHAGLLVVGSRGHGASPLYRVGGTSERLAQSASLPVLVVRDAASFESWMRGERPLQVLVALDWTRSSEPAIRFVKELRGGGPVDLIVGHVYSDMDGIRARYGLPPRRAIVERDPEVEGLLARDLAARVAEVGGEGALALRPVHGLGRVGDHLLELGDTERADLIVLGTHHRRGLARLASVAGVTLHYSNASVVVAPLPESDLLAPEEVPRVRRVLVPSDLSQFSSYAVPFAYSLLGDRGGEVFLLHVVPGPDHGSDGDLPARLRSLIPKHGVPSNVTTRTEIVQRDDVARAIDEAADRAGADAICMGSHGRSGLKRAIVGSVTEAVMRQSRHPVFVVRPLPP
jgi:nucleotide-binding universal stress UspA family protein